MTMKVMLYIYNQKSKVSMFGIMKSQTIIFKNPKLFGGYNPKIFFIVVLFKKSNKQTGDRIKVAKVGVMK